MNELIEDLLNKYNINFKKTRDADPNKKYFYRYTFQVNDIDGYVLSYEKDDGLYLTMGLQKVVHCDYRQDVMETIRRYEELIKEALTC